MLMERFVKDNNIPIKNSLNINYFVAQLQAYDNLMNTDMYIRWVHLMQLVEGRFKSNVEAYLSEYTRVKEAAIEYIKNDKNYMAFNDEKVRQRTITTEKADKIGENNIYKTTNVGKCLISFDIIKANFSILKANGVFSGFNTWESFMRKYTDIDEIIKSKYIRQVILGNCNPKRQIKAEKEYMRKFTEYILTKFERRGIMIKGLSLTNDELVLEITEKLDDVASLAEEVLKECEIPLRYDIFILHEIPILVKGKTERGYFKQFIRGETFKDKRKPNYDFKCFDRVYFSLLYALKEQRAYTVDEMTIQTEYGEAVLKTAPQIDTSGKWYSVFMSS